MIIRKLSLVNFRGIKKGEFNFDNNFNVLVGINGSGKTTIIDALGIILSRIIPQVSNFKISKRMLEDSDLFLENNS